MQEGDCHFKYESEEWNLQKEELLYKWLGDEHAVIFILTIGQITETWDDLIDKDKQLSDDHINEVFMHMLTSLPLNPFFDRYKLQLIPVLIVGINAWMDANKLEKKSKNDKVFAYVLRDYILEITNMAVYLLKGREAMKEYSLEIRSFFTKHEPLDVYLEKLK
jgi:hypothetical protein